MKRRTKSEWLALFQAHKQSGLTAAAFCRENNLCPRYFSVRKKQLLGEHNPMIRVEKPALPDEGLATVRMLKGDVQLHLQNASPDFIASLLQKLQ